MDKPEALQLADWLDGQYDKTGNCEAAAGELRLLHAENESLKRALAASCDEERDQIWEASSGGGCSRARSAETVNVALLAALSNIETSTHDAMTAALARTAIAKAEEK